MKHCMKCKTRMIFFDKSQDHDKFYYCPACDKCYIHSDGGTEMKMDLPEDVKEKLKLERMKYQNFQSDCRTHLDW